jgi:tRNA modification GTPase
VLAGKLTLAQAEALLELVSAQTPAALESALARYRGGLAAFTQRICTQLEDILAAIEYRLSFEDTESDFVPPHSGRLQRIIRSLDRELARAERSRFLSEGARVCIIGRPNAGKSSLFNRLLEKRRALVSPVRGTTRDRVDATLVLGSVPVRLEDTAGLGARPSDRLSRLAESETLSAVREADLTLAVFDRSAPEGLADRRVLHACDPRSTFIILNKTDLAARLRLVPQAPRPRLQAPNKRRSSATAVWGSGPQAPGSHLAACILPLAPSFAISCLSGSGIPRLRSAIARFVRPASGLALVSGERQLSALRACRDSLAASLQAPTTETAALEIRHALDMLSQVDTRVANEAVLDRIFARFCIGK